jgi:glycyl-tRNA synthetase beta chain
MSTQPLLIEIGTEELPPRALKQLSEAFTESITSGLAEHKLQHGQVRSFATPRRLAVQIDDLQLQAETREVEQLGPPADRARDESGNWTKAAEGFARKNGVSPDQLETLETPKGPRLAWRSTEQGIQARACLPDIVNAAIKTLPIPKRMRWGARRIEFVRPAHWAVLLLGGDIVECELLGLPAGRTTRGHRFHSAGEISLTQPGDYREALREARVVADFVERRESIRQQVDAQATALNALAVIDEDLLDEVTALVEWPVALTGSFEARFLEVPAEALVSSMKEHQKYFHLVNPQGALLPHFITVANIESTDPAQVIDGNERVIRPRLSDADFFFRTDQKRALADRVEDLNNIVFQQKLGTLRDKTRRLESLCASLSGLVDADEGEASRAALLSKTDLLTDMVGEFADMRE